MVQKKPYKGIVPSVYLFKDTPGLHLFLNFIRFLNL